MELRRWYDERLGNRDWDAIRRKYTPMAGEATDSETFATVVQLMLGELNGSHLGFTPGAGRGRSAAGCSPPHSSTAATRSPSPGASQPAQPYVR